MSIKKNFLLILLIFFLTACITKAEETSQPVTVMAVTATHTKPTTATPTASPSPTSTAIPQSTSTSTPLPDIGGVEYTGYWLKLSKEFDPNGFQKLRLFYQDGYELEEIAWFCVRASDNNSPNGFYFIAIDRATTYPTAGGGYATTFFSHNFGWKLANRNWYLHAGPWNVGEAYGCPVNNTGGCVNMRTDDFNIILNGGDYTNPETGQRSAIPNISVGTPFIIVGNDTNCRYLGQCMKFFECSSGLECFQKFTCQYCVSNTTSRWEKIISENKSLEVFP